MRIIVFSLIDDWDLGPRLKQNGHELIGWVQPGYEKRKSSWQLIEGIRSLAKTVLSQKKIDNRVSPKYFTATWLARHNIPTFSCKNVNDSSFVEFLKSQNIDLILVGVYPQIFKTPVLQIPRFGVINYHPSLLPSYAGPQPTFWMIKNGEKLAGVSVHMMAEKVDAGDILAQESFEIDSDENLGQVLQRQHHIGARLLADTVEAISQGRACPCPQNLNARSYFKRREKGDVYINWSGAATDQVNLLRALQPYEPILARIGGKTIAIYQMRSMTLQLKQGRPGEVISKDSKGFLVQAGIDYLKIMKYEIRPFHGWINKAIQRYLPRVGDCFDVGEDC